jgi:maltose alpha-D-glucosyltransferase/alpha-amylase
VWERSVADAFLREYQTTVAGAPWTADDESSSVLLRAFTLDKALHELTYELSQRPEWVWIPVTSLLKMTE